jgi:hypothetical protein
LFLAIGLGTLTLALVLYWPASSSGVPRYRGKPSAHFDGERFHNLAPFPLPGLAAVLRWKLTTPHGEWPSWVEFPQAPAPPGRVTEGARMAFINHATLLIQLAGLNILTDPVFSDTIGPISWFGMKPGVENSGTPSGAPPRGRHCLAFCRSSQGVS